MKNKEGDNNRNSEAILYLILLSLFLIIFEGKSNISASGSAYYSFQPDLALGYYSTHADAVIFDTPHLEVPIKDCGCVLYGPNINPFNLQYKILDYNRRIGYNIILIQKTRLSIISASVWKYSFHLASIDKEDLPVLS